MSKKVYVGSLPYSMTKEQLVELFSNYGEITESVLITDRFTGKSKGFGFLTFADDAMADKAIEEMNGKEINGLKIKVMVARPMESRKRNFGQGKFKRGFGRKSNFNDSD